MSFSNKKNSKSLGWQVLNSQYIFQCPYFKLRQDTIVLPNQKKFPYTYVEHPGSVFVVPISPQREIFLIHSYRYTIDDWCWEVPAGFLGDKVGLTPKDVAQQELLEELGCNTSNLESLGCYYSANGFAEQKNYFFLAHNVITEKNKMVLEATEFIDEVKTFSWQQVIEMIRETSVIDAESAFILMLAFMRMNDSSLFRGKL